MQEGKYDFFCCHILLSGKYKSAGYKGSNV